MFDITLALLFALLLLVGAGTEGLHLPVGKPKEFQDSRPPRVSRHYFFPGGHFKTYQRTCQQKENR